MKNNIAKKEGLSSSRIPEENTSNVYHFLALLNITGGVEPIMDIATALARKHAGKIIAKNFMLLPLKKPSGSGLCFTEDPLKNPWIASKYSSHDLYVQSSLALSYDRKKAVIDTIVEENIDFVIGGFQGYLDIYKNLTKALAHIPTDTMCLRFPPDKKIVDYGRILVPLLDGIHTPLAVDIAEDLATTFEQKLAILYQSRPRIYEEKWGQIMNRLETKGSSMRVERIVLRQNSIISGILKELKGDTWLILPAYRPSWWARLRTGNKQRSLLKEIIRCSYMPIMIISKSQ